MRSEIVKKIVEAVKEKYGDGYEVSCKVIHKNNGVQLNAVTIKKHGEVIMPAIYIDQLAEKVESGVMGIRDVAMSIAMNYEEAREKATRFDVSKLTDKKFVLSHVRYKLVNKELNRERIRNCVYKEVLDLVALYSVDVSNELGNADYVIGKDMLERIGISIKELDTAAMRNIADTEFEIKRIAEVTGGIAEGLGIPFVKDIELPVYIVTNKMKVNGANALMCAGVLRKLAKAVGEDLFILPSSVHEIIVVPVSILSPFELTAMVREINDNEMNGVDILGRHVYRYSKTTGELDFALKGMVRGGNRWN